MDRLSRASFAICHSVNPKVGSGERGRNRTYNLLIKSQLLCQLSYAPLLGRWARCGVLGDAALKCGTDWLWTFLILTNVVGSRNGRSRTSERCPMGPRGPA